MKTLSLLALGLLGLACSAQAQWQGADELDWKESDVPAPPAFSTEQLVPFEVSTHSELSYGLVPDTLSVGSDGVVRYVMVAQSRSGAVNVSYEGVRCQTGEMKTYARWAPNRLPLPTPFSAAEGEWRATAQADWVGLRDHPVARPAWALARTALCEGSTVNGNPQRMLRDLRLGRSRRD